MILRHPHLGVEAGEPLSALLERLPDPGPPRRTLILATEERSGSEWLGQLMGAVGRLGRPSEYLNLGWQKRFFPDYPDNIWGAVDVARRVGTTSNGVLSVKLHTWHFDVLSEAALLTDAFPDPVFVRLQREDRLGQAISLVRARQTDAYHAGVEPRGRPVYSADAIQAVLNEIAVNAQRWTLYFARNDLAPLSVTYEELQSDPDGVLARIAALVGEAAPGPVQLTGVLSIQRDDATREWRARFTAERGDLNRLDRI